MHFSSKTIGIIDSGIGGVSVLKQLIKKFSCGNFIYFADNLYMPYGNKTKASIKKRLDYIINLLKTQYNVNQIIIACNTASTCYIDTPKEKNIHLMQFSKNSVYFATRLTKDNLIGYNVIADRRLAKLIERHIFEPNKLKQCIKNHIDQNGIAKHKEVILGCTHYELVIKYFKKYAPNTNFICNSSYVVEEISNPDNVELNIVLLMSRYSKTYYDKFYRIVKGEI